jgi:dTDP-4-amino-4,6-dideoxygalactose transaminase
LGLKPGDEVIAPSFTYIATTEVIAFRTDAGIL